MKITIYGTGYVGLVSGACLAELGHEVLCFDINKAKIEQLQKGIIPIYEPGLEEIVKNNIAAGRLLFSTEVIKAVNFSTVQIITVNTPTLKDHGADISNIIAVGHSIATHMQDEKIIVNKSTAPPGTAAKLETAVTAKLRELNKSLNFHIASNPEFLKEGAAVKDFMEPDRVILGLTTDYSKEVLTEVYSKFADKLICMDIVSAELSKYAANAMLATKISFMNEMACIAEGIGADIELVKKAIGSDPRIGPYFINPGCGYGGSCFPKDVQALEHFAPEYGVEPFLLSAVQKVNQRQKKILGKKVLAYFNGDLDNKIIALWGLAFKPNTDDMREASSITLMKDLWKHGAKVYAYDPIAMSEAQNLFAEEIQSGKLSLFENAEQALENTDALVIVTEWDEFKSYSAERLKSLLDERPLFDGRNLFDPKELKTLDIKYFSIGRMNKRL